MGGSAAGGGASLQGVENVNVSTSSSRDKSAATALAALPSRCQLRRYSDQEVERNHKEYLLVIDLIQQCLDLPALRDVSLRLLSTTFVSRYRVLDSITDARTETFLMNKKVRSSLSQKLVRN